MRRKAFVESDLNRLEVVEKAERLYREGKISEAALRHQLHLAQELTDSIAAIRGIVPPQTIQITTPTTILRLIAGENLSAPIDPKVEEALSRIGKTGATQRAVEYIQAQKAFVSMHDIASQEALQLAYTRLASALAPMSDAEIHELIETLVRED